MGNTLRIAIGISFLCVILSVWATERWGNPNHTPPELLKTPPGTPARNLCVDKDGWLWWGNRLGTIFVGSTVDQRELTPLDRFELASPGSWADSVCLFVPRSDQAGVYALTTRGRWLSLSVSDSRLSATEIVDFGVSLEDACVVDDSLRTIVAGSFTHLFLFDLRDRTISPFAVPVLRREFLGAVEPAGGTRFIAALGDESIYLFRLSKLGCMNASSVLERAYG